MRNPRNLFLTGLALVALAVAFFVTLGGYGFFGAPTAAGTVTIQVPGVPAVMTSPSAKPSDPPCSEAYPAQTAPVQVQYFANSPEAAQYRDFGPSLVPGLDPLDEPHGATPDAQAVTQTIWQRFCVDPALTRAVAAAAYPNWENRYGGQFVWSAALLLLSDAHWADATMEYHSTSPTPWTMLMVAHPNAPPTTYIARANHAGWYLKVPVDADHFLLLRVGCGGQPALVQDKDHSLLWKIFHIF